MKVVGIITGLVAALILLIVLAVLSFYAYRLWLKTRFRQRYGRHGKFILFIYSDSPNWKDYVESNILPRIGSHSVILNWSERRKWGEQFPFEARVFRSWAGDSEFNPIAILFPRRGKVKVIRFWQAFRDYKHGKDRTLKNAENELYSELDRFVAEGA